MHKGRCGTQVNSSVTFSHICVHVISTFYQGIAHFRHPKSTLYAPFKPRQHYSAFCRRQSVLPSLDFRIKGVMEGMTRSRWHVPDMTAMTFPIPLLTADTDPPL